ncbi:MAG TPA: hypothetical protein VJA21_24280 [Verrucomicrobiae bacterium]
MNLLVALRFCSASTQAAPPDLPSPETLLQRHIDALGGADALRKARSLTFKGKVSLPLVNAKAPIEFLFQAPDRFLCQFRYHHAFFGFLKVPLVAKRQAECGYDGTNGWILDFDRKLEPLYGTDEAFFRGLLFNFSPLCFSRNFTLTRTLDIERFADRDCYRVLVVFPFGEHAFEFYDVKNGLLAGTVYPFETDDDVVNVQTTYSDFRPVGGGLRLPFRISPRVGGQDYTIEATEVRTDVANTSVPISKVKASSASLPLLKSCSISARQVIDRYIDACGGAESLRKHTSLRLSGHYEFPGPKGFTNQVEISLAPPSRFGFTLTTPNGLYREGCDGERFWRAEGSEIHFAAGKELAQLLISRRFLAELHAPESFRSIDTLGIINLDGHECYQLLLVRQNGEVFDEFYDVQTGWLRARRTADERNGGAFKLLADFKDYRRFGGWMLPTRQSYKLVGQPQVVVVTRAEWDTVPDATFEMPPEVKAAWERQSAARGR